MERETSQSDRERQTQASWTLVLSALLHPVLQTRGRGKERGWKVSWESRVASDLSAQHWATLLSWSEKPWDFQICPSARSTGAHWSCYYDHRRPLKTSRDSKANIFEQFPSPPWTFSIVPSFAHPDHTVKQCYCLSLCPKALFPWVL